MVTTSRRLRRAAAIALVAVGLTAPTATAEPSPTEPLNYVNMGDSYSAGVGVLPLSSAPVNCLQSSANWAHSIATTTGATLTDVSCTGATTASFTSAQFPNVPPQLEALSADTELVTLTIGGNDSDTLAKVVGSCASAGLATLGFGAPCKALFGDSFSSVIRTTTYASLVSTLNQVQTAAPNARVAIGNYLQILPATQGCFPIMPIAAGDVPYVNSIQATLNDAVRRAAEATGATLIDVNTPSQGHDVCQSAATRWVVPALQVSQFMPLHPNAAGENAMAQTALSVLDLD